MLREDVINLINSVVYNLNKKEVFNYNYDLENALKEIEDLEMYDGYNFYHKRIPLLILDCYGDEEYENIRNNEYGSLLIVDNLLNVYLIDFDILKDTFVYDLYESKSKKDIKIDSSLLHNIFGGKRAYWLKDFYNISIRFNSEYEQYLEEIGLYKEIGRDQQLSTHRLNIELSEKINFDKKRKKDKIKLNRRQRKFLNTLNYQVGNNIMVKERQNKLFIKLDKKILKKRDLKLIKKVINLSGYKNFSIVNSVVMIDY